MLECRSKCEQTHSLRNNAMPVPAHSKYTRKKKQKSLSQNQIRMKISCSIEWEYTPSRWNEVEQHNDITITSFNIPFGNVYGMACTCSQYIGTISSTSWWSCSVCCQRRSAHIFICSVRNSICLCVSLLLFHLFSSLCLFVCHLFSPADHW